MQLAVRTHSLGLLLVGVLSTDPPDVADRLTLGQEVNKVRHSTGVKELLHSLMAGLVLRLQHEPVSPLSGRKIGVIPLMIRSVGIRAI